MSQQVILRTRGDRTKVPSKLIHSGRLSGSNGIGKPSQVGGKIEGRFL